VLLCLGINSILLAQTTNVLPNPGFEDGTTAWQVGEGDSLVTAEAARTGKMGLRIINDGTKAKGSNATSPTFPVTEGQQINLSFWARSDAKGAGIYLMFLSEQGRMVQAPKGTPTAMNLKFDDMQWHQYTLTTSAPAGAQAVKIWAHTWSTAKVTVDMDDFELSGFAEDVKPILPKPYVAPPKPKPIDWDNIPKPDKPINIILKLDDLKMHRGMAHPRWQKMADYIDSKGIKCTMGMLCYDLENATPQYIKWIRDHHDSGNWEFWFHGWDHKSYKGEDGKTYNEFHHRTYEEQKKRLSDSQELAYEKLGFHFTCFGPPGGSGTLSQDEVTHQIMIDDPYITTWLYPSPIDKLGEQTNKQGDIVILDRVWGVGLESSVGAANFDAFVRGYIKYVKQRDYFTLQGHPAIWDDHRFEEFQKIIEFLIEQKANFVLPSEYSATLRKQ
jgi:peptidoglycan/xylan/chitin deacetylase (PgdA/CDA1 family)